MMTMMMMMMLMMMMIYNNEVHITRKVTQAEDQQDV